MFATSKPLILASASPRRQQLLADLGVEFTCLPADIDETPLPLEKPAAFARRMAESKAAVIAAQHSGSWVIGADTVVTRNEQILGKPADAAHALKILRSLQGKIHQVITGLTLMCIQEKHTESLTQATEVRFGSFSDTVLTAYIRTGEPMDKAGAYGIQGRGAFLVQTIQGSCSNVIGLPVQTCINLLMQSEVIVPLR